MSKFENRQPTGSSPKSFLDIQTSAPSLLPLSKVRVGKGIPERGHSMCTGGDVWADFHFERLFRQPCGRYIGGERWQRKSL